MWYSNIDLIGLKRKFNIDYQTMNKILDSFCYTEVLASLKDDKEFQIIFSEKIEILKFSEEESKKISDLHFRLKSKLMDYKREFENLIKN